MLQRSVLALLPDNDHNTGSDQSRNSRDSDSISRSKSVPDGFNPFAIGAEIGAANP